MPLMHNPCRRDFLSLSASYAAGFAGLRLASGPSRALAVGTSVSGYGSLAADAKGLLDLPAGFSYRVISRVGEEMADGLLVPDKPDGMATFAGPKGLTILMRNHELAPTDRSAFGPTGAGLGKVDQGKLYDLGRPVVEGEKPTPSAGGVTTLVYDTKQQQIVRQFLSLGGTMQNCSGGPTPWGSWISCEESVDTRTYTEDRAYACAQDHGYPFEVPAAVEPNLHAARPLKSMGRFRREAVAVDPTTGFVYQTEDMDDGALYRFVPNKSGNLTAGGKLQALAIKGRPSLDTRNWPARLNGQGDLVQPGDVMQVEWIDLDDVESPRDDLRYRAFDAGGARFARGEGIWWSGGEAYFACTTGGHAELGQLWRYRPGDDSNRGTLELFIESSDSNLLCNADNLTAAPWGDLIVCEDRQGPTVRLVGVTPTGATYPLANNHAECEFAGVCFSPDGSTLFVNIQHEGLTVAVTGPWRGRT